MDQASFSSARTRRSFIKGSGTALLGGLWSGHVHGEDKVAALPGGWNLRMGKAQTPEEAIAELEAFKQATPDLASWEKRRAAIRQGMLEGARLANLPQKPALDPV